MQKYYIGKPTLWRLALVSWSSFDLGPLEAIVLGRQIHKTGGSRPSGRRHYALLLRLLSSFLYSCSSFSLLFLFLFCLSLWSFLFLRFEDTRLWWNSTMRRCVLGCGFVYVAGSALGFIYYRFGSWAEINSSNCPNINPNRWNKTTVRMWCRFGCKLWSGNQLDLAWLMWCRFCCELWSGNQSVVFMCTKYHKSG